MTSDHSPERQRSSARLRAVSPTGVLQRPRSSSRGHSAGPRSRSSSVPRTSREGGDYGYHHHLSSSVPPREAGLRSVEGLNQPYAMTDRIHTQATADLLATSPTLRVEDVGMYERRHSETSRGRERQREGGSYYEPPTTPAPVRCLNPASEINARLDTQVEVRVYPCNNSQNGGKKKFTTFTVKPEVRRRRVNYFAVAFVALNGVLTV